MPDFRYPFSTKDGTPIRADIIQPKGFLESSTSAGSWSGGVDCTNHKLLLINVENTAAVAFTVDGVTPPPAVVSDQFTTFPAFVLEPPGANVILKVPDDFPFIWWAAEGQATTGYIYLISLEEWNTVTTLKGFERR